MVAAIPLKGNFAEADSVIDSKRKARFPTRDVSRCKEMRPFRLGDFAPLVSTASPKSSVDSKQSKLCHLLHATNHERVLEREDDDVGHPLHVCYHGDPTRRVDRMDPGRQPEQDRCPDPRGAQCSPNLGDIRRVYELLNGESKVCRVLHRGRGTECNELVNPVLLVLWGRRQDK